MNTRLIRKIIFIAVIAFLFVPITNVLGKQNINNITLNKEALENEVISLNWERIENIDYYKLYKYDNLDNLIETVRLSKDDTSYNFTNLVSGFTYKFKIEAYQISEAGDVLLAASNDSDEVKAVKVLFDEKKFKKLRGFTITKPKKEKINLRKRLGELYKGYSVVQGGCTDKEYIYYLLISKTNEKGRILKVRIRDNKTINVSGVLNIKHGNGMACNSKTNKLVISQNDNKKNTLALVDANTLKLDYSIGINYSNEKNASKWKVKSKNSNYYGIMAISYIEKYDLYIALQRSNFNLLVLNKNFKVVGFIKTSIKDKYKGNYQGMDSDEKYVYLLLSPYSNSQPNNVVLALDYNSENILDLVNNYSDNKFIEKAWYCRDNNDGTPDAVIKVNGLYEAENIYHINNTFYLSEYKNKAIYHWVTYKIPYKEKWKKVKKKVKYKKFVGYKTVKVKEKLGNGKVKYKKVRKKVYKTKYKKKKIWVYKTKYKKKKVYEFHYYKRNGYVYNIGTF